ncbi:hypothetical protein [Alteromonas lipolytica]|uniref:Uncharacterized protein n=1 Tax=Alteromonas lipolytica TaxID=1856405 RepID=A0A1E8FKA6_9ALTE|nr:hypothetical protein [Alteromonas lipolytica]OFI35873.1 hypothetical protein BFC17_11400 [Alteromonas lipolytica]GGF81547.1 hypothetical protein GCM10011338_37280 [Alteromonas lipolytica]
MQTGLKTIDNLVQRFGISVGEGHDAFQQVLKLSGGDSRAMTMKLPFCFYQIIANLPVSRRLSLHQFYLPHRKARLASFLIDEKGRIVEQVYYQRDSKYVQACKKLQGLVQQSYLKDWAAAA